MTSIILGIYLLIGLISAHVFLITADKKLKKEMDSGELSEDGNTFLKQVEDLQQVTGYKGFLILLYVTMALFWFPVLTYYKISTLFKGEK